MCSRKCFRMPTLVICGVVLTIVLVCITGITLTNSINISNIVKLREKVASDSAAANGGHQAAQTRAALVEQQYSTLQQHHMSKSDFNYISAATHPKNLHRLLQTPPAASASAPKIVIEIGLRNSGNNESNVNGAASLMPMPHMLQAADALMEGNVDSISLPAAAAAVAVAAAAAVAATTSSTSTEATTTTTTTVTTTTTANTVESTTTTTTSTFAASLHFGIADHNPAGIQFERRAHVKKVMSIFE
ncbi:hypothetical protein ACLKA6_008178 [Drosophila palustris]